MTTPIEAGAVSFAEFVWVWNETQGLPTPRHHLRMARWLARRWRGADRNGLLMAFRNSGKSTLVGLFCAWVLRGRPDTRILVMAADLALARKMARNVKHVIERHPLTRALVPERRDQWAADRFTVARPSELRDPSMLAKGIGANITGSRADLIVCDDVEVPNTCDTPAKRADLRARLQELDYVLVPGGMQLYVGTPHAFHSIYATEVRAEAGEDRPFLDGFRRLELPILDAAGRPAWPERFPLAAVEAIRRRTGPNKFTSQMMLRPVNIADGRLDPDRLRLYAGDLDFQESNGETLALIDGRRMVSAVCCWDPAYGVSAAGDGSVVAALFADAEGGYWLHRLRWLTADRAAPEDEATQQCKQVARFVRDLRLPAVRLETNGLGKFLPGLLRRELAALGLAVPVIETTARRAKDDRIVEAFDAVLAAGALHAHRSVWETPFVAEMRDWRPGGKGRDDGLDAVAACLLAEPVRLTRPARVRRPPSWRPGDGQWTARTDFSV